MATRNLTKKFLEIRNAAKANRGLGLHNRDDTDEYSEDKSLKVRTIVDNSGIFL
jgi:hypothetical protein